ncbi:MAG: hypothetical protein ABL914_01930 [Novosphingobium sp.]|uniref:hypothetical protein n=1 Tax=Novosphingobium sp. TaxID=1874826 RepID=UPI0032BAFCBD
MNQADHALTPQFDRILSRIEAGQIDQGITHLAGLLDAVLIDCSNPAAVRQNLLAHPLGAALREPVLAAWSQRLGIAAALDARKELSRSTLDHANQRGDRSLFLADSLPRPGPGQFDLILAADLPDRITSTQLEPAIKAAADSLAAGGRLVLSFFVPGHLGCGWQTIWLDQQIERHAPAAFGAAARAAGLEPRLFHDASDSLVWAELRACPANGSEGE